LLRLIEEEKRKAEEMVEEEKIVIRKKRKREWYEAFRWMFTSGGFLVIGGRDARTNELIIKKYLEEGDLFFHADVVGAPAVVMKRGEEAGEGDILEAAIFSASYSRAWRMGLYRVPVFYVRASQVTLSPPSGEYRPRGGAIIKGKREWTEAPLGIYLGFDERFFVSAVERDNVLFQLLPGRMPRDEAARLILKSLNLDKSFMDELVPLLPPGDVDVRVLKLKTSER